MRSIVLIAAAPLLLTACNLGGTGSGNSSAIPNLSGPGAIPDTVEVNGVTYVRADKPVPVATPTASGPTNSFLGSSTSDSGASVPPNTGSGGGVAADHGE